jgi:hypothetical protein
MSFCIALCKNNQLKTLQWCPKRVLSLEVFASEAIKIEQKANKIEQAILLKLALMCRVILSMATGGLAVHYCGTGIPPEPGISGIPVFR